MLQGLFGRNTLLGVVHEDLPQKIKELAIEVGMAGYGFLISLDLLDNKMQNRDVPEASSSPSHISSMPCWSRYWDSRVCNS
jgi:hypothetical protein